RRVLFRSAGITDGSKLADFAAANLDLALPAKAELLSIDDVNRRLERLAELLGHELQVLEVGTQIQEKVKSRLDANQREYVLREQLRVIRQELGEDDGDDELTDLGKRLEEGGLSAEAKKVADRELKRLRQMSPQSAEYHGHRRTYVGALPGRIIHALQRCETRNPLLMLDEVDKMGADVRGDPTAALLEVLDPAQNGSFVDHYLEVPFDLSGVMFIATANSLAPIPDPLLDRMEVLTLPGYTPGEKLAIAKRYLLPRQLTETGLTAERANIADGALERLIGEYTREAGVRQLEREIQGVLRKAALEVVEGRAASIKITAKNLEKFAGQPKVQSEVAGREAEVGVATGLAW